MGVGVDQDSSPSGEAMSSRHHGEAVSSRHRPAPDPGPQRQIRVVVAEDSYVIREFLTATLSATPEVELAAVCSNGKELQTAIELWDPDVVLTDIRMPPSGADEGSGSRCAYARATPTSASWCSASTPSRRTH